MAERRELTERNRENQQPGQPIDFCQGLPFKVRWMGRDAQTGRDLVQYPDGSIVRAGKRIFSGNCPRGTMVDVVDCGANGAITIDWRDAEIRQPLLVPEGLEDWLVLLDSALSRVDTTDENDAARGQYLQNIKAGGRVLLIKYLTLGETILDQSADTVLPSLEGVTAGDLAEYDQLWVGSTIGEVPQVEIDLIAEFSKKLVLFGTSFPREHAQEFGELGVVERVLDKKFGVRIFDGYYAGANVTYLPPEKVILTADPIFKNIPKLPGGVCSKILSPAGVNIKVVATVKAYDRGADHEFPEEEIPTIAMVKK